MRSTLAAFPLLVSPSATPAAAAGCLVHFADGAEPAPVDPRQVTRARELCHRARAALHSGAPRTLPWSPECPMLPAESVLPAVAARKERDRNTLAA